MTNLFSLRSKLFWPAMAVCLLPFVILAFLNSMALDDYFFYDLYRAKGFWGAQQDLYLTWAGRYTSGFITGIFILFDLPGRFPFLPTLLYFGFTFGAIYYLLSSVRPLLPGGFFGPGDMPRAAAVLFVLFLYVQADIATGFYWLSSTTVYQTAFILFLLLTGVVIRISGSPRPAQSSKIFLYLLIVLLTGCNEIIAVFLPLFLAGVAGAYYFYGRPVGRWLWIGLAIAIGMGLIIVFTSGVISHRQHLMNTSTGNFTIIAVIGFRLISVLFYIFKEPLFWGGMTVLFLGGDHISRQLDQRSPLTVFQVRNLFFPGIITLLCIVGGSLAVFLFASRGSIPARVLNDLSDFTTCCLLALSFFAGIHKGAHSSSPVIPGWSAGVGTMVLVFMLLASVNYEEAWKSVGSGYFYHAIVRDRDRSLKFAAARNQHVVVVPPYDTALKEKIRQVFPSGIPQTVHDLFLQKPAMLFFYDGPAVGDPAYAHFYGLDTVIVRDK